MSLAAGMLEENKYVIYKTFCYPGLFRSLKELDQQWRDLNEQMDPRNIRYILVARKCCRSHDSPRPLIRKDSYIKKKKEK